MTLHSSKTIAPAVTAIAWSGSHWLIAYDDPSPAIAIVDAEMNLVRTIDIGGSSIHQLVVLDGIVFAIRTSGRTEAIEIREDGIGVTHSTPLADGRVVVTSAHSALAFFNAGNAIEIASFTAAAGFGTATPLMSGRTVRDAIANDAGALLLHDDPSNALAVSEIIDGQVASTSTVIADAGANHEASLVLRRGGMIYTSDIPMPRGSIGRMDRPHPFGPFGIAAMGAIDTTSVVAWQDGPRITIGTSAMPRSRTVRH